MDIVARNVLIGGNSSSFPGRAARLLPPPHYALRFISDISHAMELIQNTPFQIVIVEYGGNGAVIRDFVRNLRWSGSLCRKATAVLLSTSDDLDDAEEFLNSGFSRILNPEAPDSVLEKALDEVLNHEPRYSVRALVRINGEDLGHTGTVITQTTNLSATGMLVPFEKQVFLGTRFEFTLEGPGLASGVRGTASVVRLNLNRSEHTVGFAARFCSFEGTGRDHLSRYLAAQPFSKKSRPGD